MSRTSHLAPILTVAAFVSVSSSAYGAGCMHRGFQPADGGHGPVRGAMHPMMPGHGPAGYAGAPSAGAYARQPGAMPRYGGYGAPMMARGMWPTGHPRGHAGPAYPMYSVAAAQPATPAEKTPDTTAEDAAQGADVSIQSMRFEPAATRIKAGETVTWRQQDRMPHTISVDGGAAASGTLQGGQQFSHTFTEPGTYSYSCGLHPSMRGTVVVEPTTKDGFAQADVFTTR